MPVEKPRKSGRGPRPFRATIVVGGVHGDHGAGFSKKSLPCRFPDRNPQDSSKIWQGWSWQESLLLRPPACQKPFLTSRKPIVADCLSRFRRSYNHPLNGWFDQARSGLSPAVALSRGRRVYCQLHSLLRESPFRGFVSLFFMPPAELGIFSCLFGAQPKNAPDACVGSIPMGFFRGIRIMRQANRISEHCRNVPS